MCLYCIMCVYVRCILVRSDFNSFATAAEARAEIEYAGAGGE